ncbi:MAG: spondin domain-containing protein, partial [Planctomycetota bacterium]
MMKKISILLVLSLATASYAQTQIEVTVTTTGPVGLAPVFAAFHDGSYDIFDVDGVATASAGLELLAELGDPSILVADAPAGVNAAGFAPGGPFAPNGGTGSQQFTVTDGQTMFALASMLLPSNDWFIGTSNSIDISSLLNAPVGSSINFDLSRVYDAGTELEDFMYAPGGPLVGITTPATPPEGTATADPISLVEGPDPFSVFANIQPANFDTSSIDFTGGAIAS